MHFCNHTSLALFSFWDIQELFDQNQRHRNLLKQQQLGDEDALESIDCL